MGMYPAVSGVFVLPNAEVGLVYVGSITGTGGTGSYTYTKTVGPSWMTVNSSTGAIGGTPDTAGTNVPVSVEIVDSSGVTVTVSDTFDVIAVVSATFNPLDKGANISLSNGNRDATRSSGTGWETVRTNSSKNSGKHYAEFQFVSLSTGTIESCIAGFCTGAYSLSDFIGNAVGGSGVQSKNGGSGNGFSFLDTIATNLGVFVTQLCIVSIAVDLDAGKYWLGVDNSPSGAFTVPNSDIESGLNPTGTFTPNQTRYLAASIDRTTHSVRINCGQDAYSRTPPVGFSHWSV
jgi:hypothetical protein